MNYFLSTLALFFFLNTLQSQERFLTKSGTVSFFSKAPIENIEAKNQQVLSIIDAKNGSMAISILMKSFLFEKALMQEHFNENYVESDKFPKAIFKGIILKFSDISNVPSKFQVQGTLTIHGETKEITIEGMFSKTTSEIIATGDFMVNLDDFKVKIPAVVAKNIAKNIKVSFDFNHKPFQKQ
jgi:polyisoprenoid-binding protein YceI